MTDEYCEKVKVCNKLGLHIRPSRKVAGIVASFDAKVTIRNGARSADADSQLDLLMLVATNGAELEVCATGPQARDAVMAIVAVVNDRFGEEA